MINGIDVRALQRTIRVQADEDDGAAIHVMRISYPNLCLVPDKSTGENCKLMWESQSSEVQTDGGIYVTAGNFESQANLRN